MSLGPFDLTGEPFLQLYGTLLVLTVIAGFIIPHWLRPDGRDQRVEGQDQMAFLASGRERFMDSVVTRLLASRALTMMGKDSFCIADRNAGTSTAERSVLALPNPSHWRDVAATLKDYAAPIERKLVSADLMMDDATAWQLRFWQTLPYLLLIPFGLIKLLIGQARDKPVGYLTVLLVLTALLALVRLVVVDRRTRAGLRVLKDARQVSQRLRTAPTDPEMGMAVALFGTAVLAGSAYGDFHKLRGASSGDGGGGGSSDGGCGGGGCGGCGGG